MDLLGEELELTPHRRDLILGDGSVRPCFSPFSSAVLHRFCPRGLFGGPFINHGTISDRGMAFPGTISHARQDTRRDTQRGPPPAPPASLLLSKTFSDWSEFESESRPETDSQTESQTNVWCPVTVSQVFCPSVFWVYFDGELSGAPEGRLAPRAGRRGRGGDGGRRKDVRRGRGGERRV